MSQRPIGSSPDPSRHVDTTLTWVFRVDVRRVTCNAARMADNETIALTRMISPAQHAVLDYSVASTFLTMGVYYRGRNNRASTLAFINGALVLGMSLFTNYPGGVWRKLSFKTHRTLDIVQAALAGAGPLLFEFGGAPEANAFYAQAGSEVGVIAMTDWDAA